MRELGVSPGIVHMANSGAICARPSTYADMVRPGAILYGYYQSFDPPQKEQEVHGTACRSSRASRCARASFRCAMFRPGKASATAHVSSPSAHRASPSSMPATPTASSAPAHQSRLRLVRGQRVPLVGTISMDLTMLDVTDVPRRQLGDIVTIYGKDGARPIVVSDVAREIGTVTSDLLCALGRRVPKSTYKSRTIHIAFSLELTVGR